MKTAFLLFALAGLAHGDAIGIRNFREIYASYATVTQVVPDEEIYSTFLRVQNNLPKEGKVEEFNPAMQLGTFDLASRFCSHMIASDSKLTDPSKRVAHREVNFSQSPAQIKAQVWESVVEEYAELFWQRSPTSLERTLILEWLAAEVQSGPNTVTETSVKLGLLCPLMATSIQFFIL